MVIDICRRLHKKGLPVVREIAIGLWADIAYIEGDRLYAIECKLSDWRGALNQAMLYGVSGADYAIVIMPPRDITEEMDSAFRRHGIGFAFFMPECVEPFYVEIPPKRCIYARERVMKRLLERQKRPCKYDRSFLEGVAQADHRGTEEESEESDAASRMGKSDDSGERRHDSGDSQTTS